MQRGVDKLQHVFLSRSVGLVSTGLMVCCYSSLLCGDGLAQSLSNPVSVESPMAEGPIAESPIAESPVAESPIVVESPTVESPLVESPLVESPAVAPSAGAALVSSRYLLDAGDRVRIEVFNVPDYSGEFSVLAGGVVSVPLAGEVLVEGLTLQQASDAIAAELREYVRRPRVSVSLLSARPLQVAIAGEVNRPGAYTLPTEGENTAPPTLTQLIQVAGGITQVADIRRIRVQRQMPRAAMTTALTSVGLRATASETFDVDLWQLLQTGQLDADVPLQHGDRIIISKATEVSPEDSGILASASFSPNTIAVNVVGEVKNPGVISIPPNAPLNQALLSAGGFNRRARESSVGLIRLNDNGTVTQREIIVDFESGIDPVGNPSLLPNDTIVVSTNGLSQTTDTLRDVLSPLNNGFGLLRLLGL